ncbi:AmmeMemoRadiSam system protein B [Rosettibacter firmus]|uniref:AmmeMemoRadiSam system protein B n=1 Tax=Rosettibacter firmus TaxID=3111522 RepID=UPI00336C0C58
MKQVREPSVAGMFYPSSPSKLREEIQILLDTSKLSENIDNILGIIAPHAGYIYSGKTAAYAYNAIKGKNYNTVIIISPSHREYFAGISIYNGDAYKTPLGEVPINKNISSQLTAGSKIIFEGIQGHRAEHAVEVQIPFLQTVLENFSIVPIVLGDQNRVFVYELANSLSKVVDENTLIVASSDLSHYYSKRTADELDSIVEKHISNFDYDGLQKDLENNKCEACGGGAIVALMRTADLINKRKSKVLHRSDSGDVSGDFSEVVGYLSAAIYN